MISCGWFIKIYLIMCKQMNMIFRPKCTRLFAHIMIIDWLHSTMYWYKQKKQLSQDIYLKHWHNKTVQPPKHMMQNGHIVSQMLVIIGSGDGLVLGSTKPAPEPMMTSSNGNIYHVTGHLCSEFTSSRWISHTKASDAELWCFLWSTAK